MAALKADKQGFAIPGDAFRIGVGFAIQRLTVRAAKAGHIGMIGGLKRIAGHINPDERAVITDNDERVIVQKIHAGEAAKARIITIQLIKGDWRERRIIARHIFGWIICPVMCGRCQSDPFRQHKRHIIRAGDRADIIHRREWAKRVWLLRRIAGYAARGEQRCARDKKPVSRAHYGQPHADQQNEDRFPACS